MNLIMLQISWTNFCTELTASSFLFKCDQSLQHC